MNLVFADTGVQIVCVPLDGRRRYTASQIGYGWQYCRLLSGGEGDGRRALPFLQWQIIQGQQQRLFLAVDTTLGDPELGHICARESMARDVHVRIEGLLDVSGESLPGLPKIDVCLRAAAATAGDARPVHLVVDFGNSRTGALLLEAIREPTASVRMMPFELLDRFRLDSWDEQGDARANPSGQWFSSKTRWCNAPYQTPSPVVRTEYVRQTSRGLFRSKQMLAARRRSVASTLFDDLSLVRLGREAEDLGQFVQIQGDLRVGLSSPKRYLWAGDDGWLDGAFWHMADPYDRYGTGAFSAKLAGRMLGYLESSETTDFADLSSSSFAPAKPRIAPCRMMAAALYELLCQAYCFVNSPRYRTRSGDALRAREIHSLSLSYPSGMFQEERNRWHDEAERAVQMFSGTVGKNQSQAPALQFAIDEAGAVHLSFIWSELQMIGQDPRLWFKLMGRRPTASSVDGATTSMVAARRGSRIGEAQCDEEVRVACVDIGGGTSNLMIAAYGCRSNIDDTVAGKVLHRDGTSIAGDQLVKRLLESIIVPAFTAAVGLEPQDALILFGPEVPKNRGFRAHRVEWMNRLFLPLAEAYLQCAVDESSDRRLSHIDPALVDPVVLETLGSVCDQLRGIGYYNLWQDLGLTFDRARFESVVQEVFGDLLYDYCRRIVDNDVDVVLLAGRPTKLRQVHEIIRRYLPLADSRIISLHRRFAGSWYPYQDPSGAAPGRIVDPKSAVVVGTAVQFLAQSGLLPQFRFTLNDLEHEASYYWGVMSESTLQIRGDRILFSPTASGESDVVEFTTTSQRVVIGRTQSDDSAAQAAPIYLLRMTPGDCGRPTEVRIRLRRIPATAEQEENLRVETISGTVAGSPAVLGENVSFTWRTLIDEQFFLDSGGLDNLELSQRTHA